MELPKDFKELLQLLNAHRVEYMIVGGYALALMGRPRFTGDIDVWVSSTEENARKIVAVLTEFGFSSLGLKVSDFCEPETVVQLGFPPLRIDFLTSLSGVTWEAAYPNRTAGSFGEVPVNYIGKVDFIANKKAVGRHKDLADIEGL